MVKTMGRARLSNQKWENPWGNISHMTKSLTGMSSTVVHLRSCSWENHPSECWIFQKTPRLITPESVLYLMLRHTRMLQQLLYW